MSQVKEVHTKGVGVVYQLFNQVEAYRLMNILPSYGVLVDIYYPKNTKGSVAGLKTTDLEYKRKPTHKSLKVIITNLEHYSQNGNMYESFEEDGFQLKALAEESQRLPRGSKIIVKDYRGSIEGDEEHITFVVTKSLSSATPINNKIGWKCELTPLYLMTNGSELLLNIKETIANDSEEVIPDYVDQIEIEEKKIIKDFDIDAEESEDSDILVLDKEGLYND